jgi:hypothetical protein
MKRIRTPQTNTGSIVVTILALMVFFTTMLVGLVALAQANVYRARGRIMLLQAQYAAESGADQAIAELNSGNDTYSGTSSDVNLLSSGQYRATYATTVSSGSTSKERIIEATGKVYDPASATSPSYTRKIRVTAQRSSTTTASSMLSRNIISVASGVKQITARDVYVNGFIQLNKNTTDLIAENITVAGKDTSASNCSLGGSGILVKPTTFTDPSQTKTKLNLAFNNCINPPGNSSNSDFDVTVNQSNITPILSTYIPWSQYMDGTYQNAPGGCSDWTSGTNPRTIPSTGNTKKTHYPDSGSGVATSCGTNGDLNLGSNTFTIADNVHIRANLCAASACSPTFNNPTVNTKYIFVEGTANFSSLKTSSGSGPIVLITYGTDPSSKTSVCPYGGSLYLGQSGSGYTEAPAMYLLAMNGLCIDGTKFGTSSDPADAAMLGGISGKNLYVASSPSTPRPLLLDPNFPIDEIPVDLAWRATYYQRL